MLSESKFFTIGLFESFFSLFEFIETNQRYWCFSACSGTPGNTIFLSERKKITPVQNLVDFLKFPCDFLLLSNTNFIGHMQLKTNTSSFFFFFFFFFFFCSTEKASEFKKKHTMAKEQRQGWERLGRNGRDEIDSYQWCTPDSWKEKKQKAKQACVPLTNALYRYKRPLSERVLAQSLPGLVADCRKKPGSGEISPKTPSSIGYCFRKRRNAWRSWNAKGKARSAVLLTFSLEKERSRIEKRAKEKEMEKEDYGQPTRKVWKTLSHLNQAVPNHLTDESQTY